MVVLGRPGRWFGVRGDGGGSLDGGGDLWWMRYRQ
ncbi:proline-rich receptor-like protein kinase PERK9 [Iris pallida]|uniref:Proline-rich receptor-like protein kinase PERK9 n=1 Tax=Iris pallida TaxID=29817 RepID=A0AAX6I6S6_IRIPA|nr:proline-rich receptor-like protein kinase PERK9 [Iris pallida]